MMPEYLSRNALGSHSVFGSSRPDFVKKAFSPALETAASPYPRDAQSFASAVNEAP
jgi:hypothetical protein